MILDPYNAAFNYLCDRYGKKHLGYTKDVESRLVKLSTAKSKQELLENYGDRAMSWTFNTPTDDFGKSISMLLHQYQYGRSVRHELRAVLLREGIETAA